MPRVEIPFIGPAWTNREKPLSAQTAKNMFPEINPEARNQVALHNTAGIRVFSTLEGIDRGMTDFNNLMYVVNGQTLYSIDADGVNLALGTIAGTNRCVMANDSVQLVITTGETPYRYTVAGGVEAITDPDLTNPTSVAYINNQFVFDNNNGTWGEFVTTSIEAGIAIDALDFANAEAHPDDIIRIMTFRQLVYFFGSHSIEPWENSGSGNPPFRRVNSGVQALGIAGTHAIVATSDYMYFLDNRRIPRRSNGLNFVTIGNPALGVEFSQYTKIEDCICYEFVQDNQQFVAYTFPTADRTWCFHEPSGSWFQLEYIQTGAMNNPAAAIAAPSVPDYIGPAIANFAAVNGVAITPIDASVLFTGDDLVFTLGGTYPTGITISSSTGIISGTPSDTDGSFTGLYVIATNINGTDSSTTFQIALTTAAYDPGMMTFDGSTGVYNLDITQSASNLMTAVFRINRASFTGASYETPVQYQADIGGGNGNRIWSIIWSSDAATTAWQNKLEIRVQNSAGATIYQAQSKIEVCDGVDHTVFVAFDGDNGTAIYFIDGIDSDLLTFATRVAPTTGTLSSGANSRYSVGARTSASQYYGGELGYCGISDTYLTNPTDFYHPTNGLQEIDEVTWTEWGAQPSWWNQYGTMSDNKGSEANMVASGTITGPA